MIASDGTPTAVVVAIEEYEALMSLRRELICQRRRKSMAMLRELNEKDSDKEFELPERGSRPIPDFEEEK